ncbi:MAG TPA: hypothetical protein VGB78_04040 [Thermoplasmata archaeon]
MGRDISYTGSRKLSDHMIEATNLTIQELVRLDASVPILLRLRELKKSYQRELEHELRVSMPTIKRGVGFLKEYGLIDTIPADGEVPNVKEYICLSKSGRDIAECMFKCSLNVSRIVKKRKQSR